MGKITENTIMLAKSYSYQQTYKIQASNLGEYQQHNTLSRVTNLPKNVSTKFHFRAKMAYFLPPQCHAWWKNKMAPAWDI